MTVLSLVEHARSLRADARAHKRAEAFHRREARWRMEELRAFCETHGIRFEEVKEGGDVGHGREGRQGG